VHTYHLLSKFQFIQFKYRYFRSINSKVYSTSRETKEIGRVKKEKISIIETAVRGETQSRLGIKEKSSRSSA
jgi:hypothetical protein